MDNERRDQRQEEEQTITVELEVSDIHVEISEELRAEGFPVEQQLAQQLTPRAEEVLHQLYQQGRYEQQQ